LRNCLNCFNPITGNYCAQCGQRNSVKRIHAKFFFEELFHFLTHFEKTFFETTWLLLKDPNKILSGYLKGQRKRFHSPIGFFIIWVTLQVLVFYWITNHYHYEWTFIEKVDPESMQIRNLFNEYSALFRLAIIPVAAFIHYLFLSLRRFTYYEILVAFIFLSAAFHFINIVNAIMLGVIFHINIKSWQIQLVELNILIAVYNLWFCYSFYKRRRIRYFWLRAIASLVLIGIAVDRLSVFFPWIFKKITG
jgi:hypothetical protein